MKSKLPIFIALIIGAVALFAIKSYVDRQEAAVHAQLEGDSYVVALKDLPRGTELTRDLITTVAVPKQFVTAQAIRGIPGDMQAILGQKLQHPILRRRLIEYGDLAPEERTGLSDRIPGNDRAYTVSITKGIKPGLIQPNDCIDIIGSFAMPKLAQPMPVTSAAWTRSSDMVNVVLLQNVRVLTSGDAIANASHGDINSGTDLTLAVTLQEAQILMFAADHGELGAVLRRVGAIDYAERTNLNQITFEDIDKIIGELDGQRNLRNVEVQKGLKSTAVPVIPPQ